MAKNQKPIHKVEMTDGKRSIIQQLFQEYNIENANDIQQWEHPQWLQNQETQ